MVGYSPIGSVGMLHELWAEEKLGNYLLLLAHDVLENVHDYENLLDVMREDKDVTIILDNGTVERGSPVPLADLLEAASLVDPTCVVGPDVIGNFRDTKKLMMEQGDTIRESYNMMLIPQGECLEEVCECIRWMDERFPETGSQWWGIPRWQSNEFGTRAGAINYINNYARGNGPPNIHLLGMSKHLDDDIRCAQTLSVRGIDSANPLVLAYLGLPIEIPYNYSHEPRGDYWEEAKCTDLTLANVEWVRNAINP